MIHGILFDEGILTDRGIKSSKFEVQNIKTISDICDIAKNLRLKLIYILGGSKIFNRLALNHRVLMQKDQKFAFKPEIIKNVITADYGRVNIVFCGELTVGADSNLAKENLANQWSLFDIKTPERLFEAVCWLYKHLNVLPSVPIQTGRKMVELFEKEKLEPLNEDTEIYHENRAIDLIFLDKFKASGKKYIHGFDKNSAYANAARSYSFGLGDSILQKGGDFNPRFHGLWKIEINRKGLSPEILSFIDRIKNDNEYLWTSDVDIIEELGGKIRVIEANVWKFNKRIFEKFCKTLLDTRSEAKVLELKIEEDAIKKIFTKFFGWLSRKQEWESSFYRPDWYSAIISQTRANMIRNIFSVRDANSEIQILGCHRDELFLATDKNLDEIFTGQIPALKAYKFSWSFEVKDVHEIINAASSAADLTRKLKEYKSSKAINKFTDTLSKTKISGVRVNG